jgi:catechol 2,3-dioxygenase-like lactoylglutathione lyase family enzyme
MRLNHLMLTVKDVKASRNWYVAHLGLTVEFEVPDLRFIALKDDSGFGFLMQQGQPSGDPAQNVKIYFEVEDVDQLYAKLQGHLRFEHPPQNNVWGYGPQLRDPDGYVLRFFDHRSVTQ